MLWLLFGCLRIFTLLLFVGSYPILLCFPLRPSLPFSLRAASRNACGPFALLVSDAFICAFITHLARTHFPSSRTLTSRDVNSERIRTDASLRATQKAIAKKEHFCRLTKYGSGDCLCQN